MTGSSASNELALFPKSLLLITESEDEFESLRSALVHDIGPRCVIEQMFVADIADIVWDLRRAKR